VQMNEKTEIVCPHCGGVNRVERARLTDGPRCGRCKQELFGFTPIQLTADNFDKTLSRNGIPVVVEFWSPSCGYCKMMAPTYQQAAAQLEPLFRLAQVNIQTDPMIASRFGVQGVPTTIIFKNGKEVARQAGAMDLGTLVGWVRYYS
jgi:thioredoxin 2